MRRSRLSLWVSGVSRGFRGWRFAAFTLTLLLAYNLFVLVILFAPAPNAEVGEFADNFRQWCFGYEQGDANIHYVINYFVGPILLGGVVLGVWGRQLLEALRRKRRAFALPVLGALFVAALAGGALVAISTPRANAEPDRIPDFPADVLRTARRPEPFELTNHAGEAFRLNDYRQRVVLITGHYSHCNKACPMIFAQLRSVVEALSPAELSELTVAAITLDPERDDIKRLAQISEAQKLTLPTYQLLTGGSATVNKVLDDYGFMRKFDPETGEIDHNNLFIVIDRGGKVAYTFTLGQTQQAWLIEALHKLLAEPGARP